MNLAGEAIVVIDLARLLGVTPDSEVDPLYRHVIVLGQEDNLTALLVDRVEDVRRIEDNAVTPADEKTSVNDCVVGQVDINGATAHLLDVGRIFLAAERTRFADIRRSEQARLDALEA